MLFPSGSRTKAMYGALVEEAQRLQTDGDAPSASDLVSRETLTTAFAADA